MKKFNLKSTMEDDFNNENSNDNTHFLKDIAAAEKAILSSLIFEFDKFNEEVDIYDINDDLFVSNIAKKIFLNIKKSYESNLAIDTTVILNSLNNLKTENDRKKAIQYISDLDTSYSLKSIQHYLDILKNYFIKKNLDYFSNEILKRKISLENFDDVLEDWRERFLNIVESNEYKDYLLAKDVIDDYEKLIEAASNKSQTRRFLKTKYNNLDWKIKGLIGGQLLILAARPGIGKTTFALNILNNNLNEIIPQKKSTIQDNTTKEKAIGFFSLEMTKESLIEKMIAINSKVEQNIIKRPLEGLNIDDVHHQSAFENSKKKIASANILFCDSATVSIGKIASLIKKWSHLYDLKLVIIDYLQLIHLPMGNRDYANMNQQQKIGLVSRTLKLLCNDLNIPILALAQLNRKTEERKSDDKEPILSDLRESGSIEQDSDIVMFLYHDNKKSNANDGNLKDFLTPEVILKIGKNRHGEIGNVGFVFEKKVGRFKPIINFNSESNFSNNLRDEINE